jgi:hypothetical protein
MFDCGVYQVESNQPPCGCGCCATNIIGRDGWTFATLRLGCFFASVTASAGLDSTDLDGTDLDETISATFSAGCSAALSAIFADDATCGLGWAVPICAKASRTFVC